MRNFLICSHWMGHSQNVGTLKMLNKITLKLCVGMHEIYMNFMFRLGSHTQDIPLSICRYSKSEKKMEAVLSQAFQTWMYNLNQAYVRVSLGPMVFH